MSNLVSDKITAFEADLRVILEKCWLSNSSNAKDYQGRYHILVGKSCPARHQVKLSQNHLTLSPGFRFQVIQLTIQFEFIEPIIDISAKLYMSF